MFWPLQTVEETSFLDEKTKATIFGLLKNPMVKMMLGNAKSKTAGVKITDLYTDTSGLHFVLEDSKIHKTRKVIITKADLEQIIRFVME